MTKPQRKALQHIVDLSKGWPVGIPLPELMARRLVDLGLAEWAPAFFKYPKPVSTVRITEAGKCKLKYN